MRNRVFNAVDHPHRGAEGLRWLFPRVGAEPSDLRRPR